MASQCVIEFIGREMKLVKEIEKLRTKSEDQDNYITKRHQEIQQLKKDKQELIEVASQNEKMQDELQKKVLKVFDSPDPETPKEGLPNSSMIVQLQNKNHEVEVSMADSLKKIDYLNHIVSSQSHKIKELVEEVREKETKFNIVEQKMFEHLARRNNLESENKTLRLAGSLEKLGNNSNNNIQMKNLVINIRSE